MSEEQYYTPVIEDFRIGYECEADISFYTNAFKPTWNTNTLKGVGSEIIKYHSWGMYRTAYLTKEQIETEGWLFQKNLTPRTKVFFKGNNLVNILYNFENHRLRVAVRAKVGVHINLSGWDQIFDGQCKSINEFRTIIKLLGV